MTVSDGPVVDFGSHFVTPMFDEVRGIHEEVEAFDGEPICTDIDAFLARYAEAGVDRAVLSQPHQFKIATEEGIPAANDTLLEVVRSHEELYGLALVPVALGGEFAAREFERALDAGYNGGVLETKTDGIELVDEELEPVFEVADRTGAPLFVHPKMNESLGEGTLDDHWELNRVFGREIAMAESITKVIHRGVYDRYPDLKLVFHHNGGNIASYLGRMDGSLARAHRSGKDHLKTYDEFLAQFESRVYVDTAGYYGDAGELRGTLEALPASNVLFATDFPYETVPPAAFREIVDAIEAVRGGAERDAILGGNALDVLVNVE